jgi:RND family efflux transporter MFP subunit
MKIRHNRSLRAGLVLWIWVVLSASAAAKGNEGFTEPRYQILVAAPETGIVKDVLVQEGDRVKAGQVLGILDDDILEANLAIARKAKESLGAIQSAKAELSLKEDRLKQFEELRQRNHASAEEVERAAMEKEVAQARLLAAQEAQEVKELEFRRAEVLLARRRVTSPIDGVVIEVHKDQGEFVSPTDAVMFTVVQLDPLLATFSVPAPMASALVNGQSAAVDFETGGQQALGRLVYVSPVIHAQSGTVKVKVEIPNESGKYQSGQRCRLRPEAASLPLSRGSQTKARE